MAEEQDTTQIHTEGQGEAQPPPATTQPPETKTAPEPSQAQPADELAPREGESLEAYSARVRSEVNWRNKQIDRQHRKIKESEANAIRLAEIEAENQRLKAPPSGTVPPPAAPMPTPQGVSPQRPQFAPQSGIDPNTLATARRQVLVERTTEQLNKHPEWNAASANFQKAGGIPEPVLDDVLATDNPTAVLIALGKDMAKYQEILDMTENRRRAVIYQIGMQLEDKAAEPKKEVRKPSEAPPPVPRLQAGGEAVTEEGLAPDRDDRFNGAWDDYARSKDKYSSDQYDREWYAARARQKANSQGRVWSLNKK